MPTCTCVIAERRAEYEENHVCELKLPVSNVEPIVLHNGNKIVDEVKDKDVENETIVRYIELYFIENFYS